MYGKEFCSYNVHNLLHITADAKKFGPVDSFSCFPFENYLYELKRMLRTTSKPLQQVVKRFCEKENASCGSNKIKSPKIHFFEGPCPVPLEGKQYLNYFADNFELNTKRGNNVCKLNDGSVAQVLSFIKCDEDDYIIYKNFCKIEEFFNYPCSSLTLGICIISELSPVKFTSVAHILTKCVIFPIGDRFLCYVRLAGEISL